MTAGLIAVARFLLHLDSDCISASLHEAECLQSNVFTVMVMQVPIVR